MVLLYASDVGSGAWWRLARDGVIAPLTRDTGHAADVPRSRALRAASLAPAVPRRAALTGLCALWVHGWNAAAPAPMAIEVAVPRGCHPGTPPCAEASQWSFVTDQAACRSSTVMSGVGVADPSHSVASALARAPLAPAIEAAWWTLSEGLVDRSSGLAAIRASTHGEARIRASSAWDAACTAAGAL